MPARSPPGRRPSLPSTTTAASPSASRASSPAVPPGSRAARPSSRARSLPGHGRARRQELLSEFPPQCIRGADQPDLEWASGQRAFASAIAPTHPFPRVEEPDNSRPLLSTQGGTRGIDVNPPWAGRSSALRPRPRCHRPPPPHVELTRNVATINPFTRTAVTSAGEDRGRRDDHGYGWNLGLLHKVTPRISWGFSLRSKVSIDYDGEGRLTTDLHRQRAARRAGACAHALRHQAAGEDHVDFPDMASLGVAVGVTSNLLVEVDGQLDRLERVRGGGNQATTDGARRLRAHTTRRRRAAPSSPRMGMT